MSLERMIRSVLTDVWYMTEDRFMSLMQFSPMAMELLKSGNVVLEGSFMDYWDEEGRKKSLENTTVVNGGVAIMPIHGVLAMDLDDWEKNFATDYLEVEMMFERLNEDEDVSTIVMDVDSPGGSAQGCHEASHVVAASRKPVFAFTRGLMASAAYFLSAGSTAIYSSPSAIVGSIGTYCAWLNYKGLFDKWGLATEVIKSGEHKAAGIGGTDLTEEQREELQKFVDYAGADFRSFVNGHRPGIAEDNMQGQAYWGEVAMQHGFVDSMASLDQTIEDAREYAQSRR